MESWFIPLDIIMTMFVIFAIVLALICLLIIVFDKTCRTVAMILVANSCLALFLLAIDILGNSLFALQNDLKQIDVPDSLCVFRSYLGYTSLFILNYSFVIQAFYRYVTVVYPARLFWKSTRNQVLIISLTWIIGFIYPIPSIFIDKIIYNVDNQICQVPLGLNFTIIYMANSIYVIPNVLIIIIYLKLVRHVHQMSKRVASANILFHAKRELAMVRRAVMLSAVLITLGFPYFIFLLMSFFTSIHKYHFRIAYVFIDVPLVLVMIILFQFTEPLKTSIMKRINRQTNVIIPTVA